MVLHWVQFSAVAIGSGFTPSAVNADFLAKEKIVPVDWQWVTLNNQGSDALALVQYSSGVSIRVERKRLVVAADLTPQEWFEEDRALTVARTLVESWPYISYTAFGINFGVLAEQSSPEDYLRERFLQPSVLGCPAPLRAAGLRLVYSIANGVMNLSLDSGTAQQRSLDEKPGLETKVILVGANFHHEFKEPSSSGTILAGFERASEYKIMLGEAIRSLFGLQEGKD
jgi:hypothetical protein